MLELAPAALPARCAGGGNWPAPGARNRKLRVGLLAGCVQRVLIAPQINAATVRLLNRLGADVIIPGDLGCCGALTHHLGHEADAMRRARATIEVWTRRTRSTLSRPSSPMPRAAAPCSRIMVICSATVPMPKAPQSWSRASPSTSASFWSALAIAVKRRDRCGSPINRPARCSTAKRSLVSPWRCSLLPASRWWTVPEGHLCCGSAGTYNLLQPVIATRLRDRKIDNIASIAAGRHRLRQHRLHHPARIRHLHPDRAHCRASRLGLRRAAAGEAEIGSRQIGR